MKKVFASLLLAAFGGLGLSAQAAGLDQKLAAELLQKSGFNSQLTQIEATVQGDLNRTPGLAGKIPEADLEILRGAFSTAFAAGRLETDASEQVTKLVTPETATAALVWLNSDLGQRITKLEDEAGKAEGFEERTQAAIAVFKTLPQRRIERYMELAKQINVGEVSAGIVINTSLAVVRGAAALNSDTADEGIAAIRSQLEQNRPKLVEQLNAQYLVLFAGAYQTLEDKEIDQYLAFSASPAGSSYNTALGKLLDVVMTRASLESGRLIAAAKRGKQIGA